MHWTLNIEGYFWYLSSFVMLFLLSSITFLESTVYFKYLNLPCCVICSVQENRSWKDFIIIFDSELFAKLFCLDHHIYKCVYLLLNEYLFSQFHQWRLLASIKMQTQTVRISQWNILKSYCRTFVAFSSIHVNIISFKAKRYE